LRERGGVKSFGNYRLLEYLDHSHLMFVRDAIDIVVRNLKAIVVWSKSAPGGAMGALFNEVSAAAYSTKNRPIMTNYIYGLGGRDFSVTEAQRIMKEQKAHIDAGHITTDIQQFSGVRGPKLGFFRTRRD